MTRCVPKDLPSGASTDDASIPLTRIQQAYIVGRSVSLNNLSAVPCQIYQQLELLTPDIRALGAAPFQNAQEMLIARHEALRTKIDVESMQQRILAVDAVISPNIGYSDLCDLCPASQEQALRVTRRRMQHQVFPLDTAPMFQAHLDVINQDKAVLHVCADLIILDFVSLAILLEELMHLLGGRTDRLVANLPSLRECMETVTKPAGRCILHRRQPELEELGSAPHSSPDLPRREKTVVLETKADFCRLQQYWSAEQFDELKSTCRKHGARPCAALIGVYASILQRWKGTFEAFSIGLTTSMRGMLPLEARDTVVGNFTSAVSVSVEPNAGQSFSALAQAISKELERLSSREDKRASEHPSSAPAYIFTGLLGSTRGSQRMPMGLGARSQQGYSSTPGVVIDFQAIRNPTDGGMLLRWDVRREAHPEGMLEEMFEAFVGAAASILNNDAWARPLEIDIETQLITRRQANRTAADLALPVRMESAFLQYALANPERIAVEEFEGESVSYGQLRSAAERIASHVRLPVLKRPDQKACVGLLVGRSWRQAAAVYGCLHAGASFVPLSAAWPDRRLKHVLDDARALAVIVDGSFDRTRMQSVLGGRAWFSVEHMLSQPPSTELSNDVPGQRLDQNDDAYILYTSGSTGLPKGVVLSHRAVLNTCYDIFKRCKIGAKDAVLAVADFTFDLSIFDLSILCIGAKLIMLPEKTCRDPQCWGRAMTGHGVTIWNSVPSAVQMLLLDKSNQAAVQKLRVCLLSGDVVQTSLLCRLRSVSEDLSIWTLGGATEAAIWSIAQPCGTAADASNVIRVPYGVPLSNQRWYCVQSIDPWIESPTWVTGELLIAGDGLAQGYTDEQETRKKFVQHPSTDQRLFRTGDLGRYLPSGQLEIFGRSDDQIKTDGGRRVSMGEIEQALICCKGVEAAVAVQLDSRALAVCVVFSSAFHEEESKSLPRSKCSDLSVCEPMQTSYLQEACKALLPAYMLPRHWFSTLRFPVTGNGKIDRRAVKQATEALLNSNTSGLSPKEEQGKDTMDIEYVVICSFARILGLNKQQVAATSDFFELGGSSMQAVQVVLDLQRLYTLRADYADLFQLD
ncbi:amino acid adenylation domain-containing protein [Ceraceosorus bombacis]|uniref:Amino acid adenylation domain-containing protein n=1 Tax=Ceraceosorus bombacis TaxID=401625 RepID=A0A0P1BDW4_9BASI|nr:amino acid adenylation domain-containing protein [Ceraceosorus bombacis]